MSRKGRHGQDDHGAWEYDVAAGRMLWSAGVYALHGAVVVPGETDANATLHRVLGPDELARFLNALESAADRWSSFVHRYRVTLPGGESRTLLVRGAPIGPRDAPGARLVGTIQDVTGAERDDEYLWHLANHDPLSGLFNRRRFMEELRREVALSRRTGRPGAVLILDLDHFKDINDSLGHAAGDALLSRIADRLRGRLRATDTLARLGGDEFAVVLADCSVEDARRVATELLEATRRHSSVRIAGRERKVSASIGIAPFGPEGDHRADELLVQADLAMYRAKENGRSRVEVFGEEMRAELAARIALEGELREALERGELRVHYQPVVGLDDGATRGCEALVRWEHPARGIVAPGEFMAVAEQSGLLARIDRFVLERACEQAARWRRAGHDVYVSVNVSLQHLVHKDAVPIVAEVLERNGLAADALLLEIKETALVQDRQALGHAIDEMRSMGVRIALDDFGGGPSSLGMLRDVSIDQLKVDRSFIEGVTDHADDRAIVAAVLSLASELGIEVVAEGVETEQQAEELRALGCPCVQGFLYSRARFPEDLDLGPTRRFDPAPGRSARMG